MGGEAANKIMQCFALRWHKLKISIYFTNTQFSFQPGEQIINSHRPLCPWVTTKRGWSVPYYKHTALCTLSKASRHRWLWQCPLLTSTPKHSLSAPLWAKQKPGPKLLTPLWRQNLAINCFSSTTQKAHSMVMKRMLRTCVPGWWCPTKPYAPVLKSTKISNIDLYPWKKNVILLYLGN